MKNTWRSTSSKAENFVYYTQEAFSFVFDWEKSNRFSYCQFQKGNREGKNNVSVFQPS